jgi:hypothetical protein
VGIPTDQGGEGMVIKPRAFVARGSTDLPDKWIFDASPGLHGSCGARHPMREKADFASVIKLILIFSSDNQK